MNKPNEIRISYDGELLPEFNAVLKKCMWKLGFGSGSVDDGIDTTDLLFLRIIKTEYTYYWRERSE